MRSALALVAEILSMAEVSMTPDQYAKLEQVAREWLKQSNMDYVIESDIESLVALLASQRAAVLEEAATRIESFAGPLTSAQCDGCGNYDDVAEGSRNDAYRYAATQLRQLAQEQRP